MNYELAVRKPFKLIPRFHEMVKSDFEKSSPKLGNIEIEITDSIRRLQRILLDLLQKSLLDIKKSGKRILQT